MNQLIEAFSTELGYHWAWLAGSSIKATAWLLLVLTILQLTRRTSAGWRHLMAVCGAMGIPLVFLLNLSLIPDELGWQPFAQAPVEQIEAKIVSVTQVEAVNAPFQLSGPSATDKAASSVFSKSFDGQAGIVALWCLGCFVVGIRFLLRLRTPQLSNLDGAPGELKAELERECDLMNLREAPTLLITPNAMPMVYGLKRASIILPTAAIDWSTEKLTSVLRHELAHLRRRDVGWSMMVEAALLPVWWHPLARILRRRALEWTEQACDDAVINTGIAPTRYATDLLSLSQRGAGVPTPAYALAALSGNGQQARFQRVLSEDTSRATVTSQKAAGTGLLALTLLIPATLLVSCSTAPQDPVARDLPTAVIAPVVNLPVTGDAKQIRLSVKFFEINFPSDQDLETPGLSEWLQGKTKLLSAEQGAELFDPHRPGSDILSAPHIVAEPGGQAKLEVGSQVPLSNQEKPAFTNIGIEFVSQVWPTDETNTLKVNLTGSVREVVGHQPDETGFDVPQIRHLQGKYQGILTIGSYLLIGQPLESVLVRDKVPVLGDVPLVGKMFRSSKIRHEKKVIAAQLFFSDPR